MLLLLVKQWLPASTAAAAAAEGIAAQWHCCSCKSNSGPLALLLLLKEQLCSCTAVVCTRIATAAGAVACVPSSRAAAYQELQQELLLFKIPAGGAGTDAVSAKGPQVTMLLSLTIHNSSSLPGRAVQPSSLAYMLASLHQVLHSLLTALRGRLLLLLQADWL
jgi:hypothetical protein